VKPLTATRPAASVFSVVGLAVELAAIARGGRRVVFAPALPRLDRVVRNGRPWIEGAPLGATAA
jgi:hypothetical protein